MKINEAVAIIDGKKQKEQELEEAQKVIEEDKEKQRLEKIRQEEEKRREEIKEMTKRFPTHPCTIHTFCWKCARKIIMNNSENLGNHHRILRIVECSKCGAFNVDKIERMQGAGLKYERYLRGKDFN